MSTVPKERVLYLEDANFGESTLVKVQRGTTLIFKLSPRLHGIKVTLFTNYKDGKDKFDRKSFQEVPFTTSQFDENSATSVTAERSGTFSYYFLASEIRPGAVGGGWFLVDPDLRLKDKPLPLTSISMVTYMAKCLGAFKDWEGRLSVARESGFNFIHFTPVQALGGSGSGYSLLNQLELNSSFGKVSWDEMKSFTTKLEKEWGMLSLCDIVLNHTANESPWLKEHPEAAYNLQNSPHLLPAYLLDRLLLKLGLEVGNGDWEKRGVPSEIHTEEHLNNLRGLLHEQIRELRLEEFYLISEGNCRIDSQLQDNQVTHTYKRFGAKVGGNTPSWKVEQLNEEIRRVIRSHLEAAVENVIAGARYERIQEGGPKYANAKVYPLFHRYFEEINGLSESESKEVLQEVDPSRAPFIMAHNGWVMNDDPLRNFADATSNVYLRRELIAWGDSVKLRYGNRKEDSPFLWSYMKEYAELTASAFHGLRLDNCHSTPIHVAEELIDAARAVRPELLVVAELFTNSDAKDNVFVNHLGINVLIREAQQAWNSHEQGRLLFLYGGKPVGAFEQTVPPAVADALLFDQTHDNPSPLERRCLQDILPTAALVSFGACAVGSNRGYDDIVPHHIHVVHESRQYTSFSPHPKSPGEVGFDHGLFLVRKTLNRTHFLLGQEGFSETYIDQLDPDVVSITRSNPRTRESMILVGYTAFSKPAEGFKRSPNSVRAIEVEGEVAEILFEGRLISKSTPFVKDEKFINGIDCDREWREKLEPDKSEFVKVFKGDRTSKVQFENFQPGDVVAFKVKPFQATAVAIEDLHGLFESADLEAAVEKLNLLALNYVMYRCSEEDGGVYTVPNFGAFVYAGLQGIASVLQNIALTNNLGHPFCSNLREGKWLMDCIVNRFLNREETHELGVVVGKLFQCVSQLPNYLSPTYFEQCFRRIYNSCVKHALKQMGTEKSGELCQLLSLTSMQFVGVAEGGALPAGGDYFSFIENDKPFIPYSLSAGLPHFSTGYMRNWGRDTFIALPGILLLTRRYEEAKQHILSYASVLRNGLIPNLMNKGNCRYNCRDATWWWLYSIVKYMQLVPNGVEILNENVKLQDKTLRLQDVTHLAIETHFQGINFREENAGSQIDAHMTDEGFNISIRVDPETGFIYGGNAFNCGTWMDKMGCSDAGGNRGTPATPRDGASVEIIGLSAAVLKALSETKEYEHASVQNGERKLSYEDWYKAIKTNFERSFFVTATTTDDQLVNIRDIYKDTIGASNGFGDYQLRPNFLVAMVVAPEIVTKANALAALDVVKAKLVSILGIKTLDSSDYNYNGDYYNTDTSDYKTAGGFNYHQGPEWVWPMGYYLRARLLFAGTSGVPEVKRILSKHYDHIRSDPWRSLPELTNSDGKVCFASCNAQAWSCGALLEVLYDLEKLK